MKQREKCMRVQRLPVFMSPNGEKKPHISKLKSFLVGPIRIIFLLTVRYKSFCSWFIYFFSPLHRNDVTHDTFGEPSVASRSALEMRTKNSIKQKYSECD